MLSAALFILALIAVRGLGQRLGPRAAKSTRVTYAVALPLASLVILAAVTMALEGGMGLGQSTGSLLTLLVLAAIVYFAVRLFAGK